jgi:MFS family permease
LVLHLLPPGTLPGARLLLAARALRAFGDGFVSLLLPIYLTLLGFSALEIGFMVTATLLGSGLTTLAVGFVAHRFGGQRLLLAGAALMVFCGLAVTVADEFWPLLLIALLGVLNPTSGDVTLFAPLEHTLLSNTAKPAFRTALFARYSVLGSLVMAVGAQAAALPAFLSGLLQIDLKQAVQAMFVLYAAIGASNFALYRHLALASPVAGVETTQARPLGKSRRTVYRLAALFSLDAFGGGFVAQSLLALWLFQRFELSITAAGVIFFWMGLFTALSQLASPAIAARFGLVNTMVYTHIPANVFLALVPFMSTLESALVLLALRSLLSSMDVPARNSYVMAVVTPGERPAAASFTAVPRSLASAASPTLAGYLLVLSPFGWSLVIAGVLKITYDVLLLRNFSTLKPPEETPRAETRI